ncbi:MAG: hypothetical protein A2231_06795 [Candidatus Firestonebacteria bacterium RIFOXYA2_FULL_40_8]|nr:MAG: hypothetical protein A2231_06795 [Candidatus Firestonebacteria bacterium RIFOXYA2_FULL_40_8]
MHKTLIGVFSDTHRNLDGLRQAAETAKALGAAILIHLGDSYKDGETLFEYSNEVLRVPGLYEPEYKNPEVPNRFFTEINGFNIFLTHSDRCEDQDLPGDIDPRKVAIENQADIYLYGHTHLYEATIKGDSLFLNPGSLKAGDNRCQTMTFGLLELSEKKATGKVMDLDGKVLVETVLLKL